MEIRSSDKTIANTVAILFLFAMFTGMIDQYWVVPYFTVPIENLSDYSARFAFGASLVVAMSLSVVGIAAFLHQIIKRYEPVTAVVYLGFRVVESVLLVIGAISALVLSTLAMKASGDPAIRFYIDTIRTVLLDVRGFSYQIAMIALGLGSIFLCISFLRNKLLPKVISITGIIGYSMLFASAVLELFGVVDTAGFGMLLYIPGSLFEIFLLPIWLLVKGFSIQSQAL